MIKHIEHVLKNQLNAIIMMLQIILLITMLMKKIIKFLMKMQLHIVFTIIIIYIFQKKLIADFSFIMHANIIILMLSNILFIIEI